jgi:hypothetical protein
MCAQGARGEIKPGLALIQHPAPGRLRERDSKSGDTHVDVIVEDSRTGVRLPPPPVFACSAAKREDCRGIAHRAKPGEDLNFNLNATTRQAFFSRAAQRNAKTAAA